MRDKVAVGCGFSKVSFGDFEPREFIESLRFLAGAGFNSSIGRTVWSKPLSTGVRGSGFSGEPTRIIGNVIKS